MFTYGHCSESRKGLNIKYAAIMVSFLCCVLVISIVYSYLGYYLYRWSKKSPSIYLLYVKFLCCNDLEKAEMPLALWKIHLLFAISNHDHIYICCNEGVFYNFAAFFSMSFLHQPLYAPYASKNPQLSDDCLSSSV